MSKVIKGSGLTAEKIQERVRDRKFSWYLVKDAAGREVGLLEKWADTRSERHPWKALIRVGLNSEFLAAFYPEDGGRDAALACLAAALKAAA